MLQIILGIFLWWLVGGLLMMVIGPTGYFIAFLIPLVFLARVMYQTYGARWYLLRGQVETGPYSLQGLGRVLQGQPAARGDQVRISGSDEWRPFELLVHAPPRFRNGILGAVAGFLAGWFLGYAMFGTVNGSRIDEMLIFSSPTKSLPRKITEGAMRIGVAGAQGSRVPGISEAGAAAREGFKMIDENTHYAAMCQAVERMRMTAIGMSIGLALVFFLRSRPSYEVVLGRMVPSPGAPGQATPPSAPPPPPTAAYKLGKLVRSMKPTRPAKPVEPAKPNLEATFEPVDKPRRPRPSSNG